MMTKVCIEQYQNDKSHSITIETLKSNIKKQAITLISALTVAGVASPTIGYAGYFYADCAIPSIDAANAYAGSCINVENFPIKSFTAYVESGSCGDGTSAVLNTYTAASCNESTLFESFSVDSKKQCFEADVTLVSLKAECI
jgi:hypothetical protein